MNKFRLTNWIVIPILALAVIFAFEALKPSASTGENPAIYTGRGDYHLYEEQISLPGTGGSTSSRASIGMGDLRRFEAQQNAGALESRKPAIGMGDLRRFEAQQNAGALESHKPLIGMGDLRRYEWQLSQL